MNARHEKFAQALAQGLSQRKAYLMAFPEAKRYKDETVDNKAYKLAKDNEVKARIEEIIKKSQDDAIMTRIERMIALSDIAKNEQQRTDNRIKAIDTLNKMDGQYIQKVEVSTPIDESAKAIEQYFNAKNANS